jgi:hypothetical protein
VTCSVCKIFCVHNSSFNMQSSIYIGSCAVYGPNARNTEILLNSQKNAYMWLFTMDYNYFYRIKSLLCDSRTNRNFCHNVLPLFNWSQLDYSPCRPDDCWLIRPMTVVAEHYGIQGALTSHTALRQSSQLFVSPVTWAVGGQAAIWVNCMLASLYRGAALRGRWICRPSFSQQSVFNRSLSKITLNSYDHNLKHIKSHCKNKNFLV